MQAVAIVSEPRMSVRHAKHDQRDDEVTYMDRALEAWASWAFQRSNKLGYPECGNIWGLKQPSVDRKMLKLTDDQLVVIDVAIAKLPFRSGRKVIFVEYWQHEPQEVKAKRFNLHRLAYRRKLDKLRYELYQACMPQIENWRLAVL